MRISGSDSRTGGVESRPNAPGAEVRWDERRIEGDEETYMILPQFVEDINRTFSDDLLRV